MSSRTPRNTEEGASKLRYQSLGNLWDSLSMTQVVLAIVAFCVAAVFLTLMLLVFLLPNSRTGPAGPPGDNSTVAGPPGPPGPASNSSNSSTTRVFAQYHLNISQPLTNGLITTIVYDTADTSDPNVNYNSGTGTFTLNSTGYYSIVATVAFAASTTGIRDIFMRFPGSSVHYGETLVGATGTVGTLNIVASHVAKFPAGTTINVLVIQTSGGTLNATGQDVNPFGYCKFNIIGALSS